MGTKSKCEAPELGAAVQRMMRALGKRAAEGDTEALEQLGLIEHEARALVGVTLGQMRQVYSLSELARVTGTSRPAVLKRSRAHITV